MFHDLLKLCSQSFGNSNKARSVSGPPITPHKNHERVFRVRALAINDDMTPNISDAVIIDIMVIKSSSMVFIK